MGITIHYRGQLKSPDLIKPICSELKDIAQSMGWEYTLLNEDFVKPNTAKLELNEKGCEITGHLPLKGITLSIHKDCSSFALFFDVNGALRDPILMAQPEVRENKALSFISIKTQFAPPDIHITIIKLLKYLQKKFFRDLEVIDEGKYWDTEDEEILKEKLKFLSDKIDAVSKILNDAQEELKSYGSNLEIAAKIEKIL